MERREGRVSRVPLVFMLVAGLMLSACGYFTPAAPPTPEPSPTPAPRPTADPPAAVNAWYAAAQTEETVRIRVDLSPQEIDAVNAAFARRYPKVRVQWLRGADRDLIQATLGEARSGTWGWDVYLGDSATMLKTARVAARWTPPESRMIPQELIDPEGAWYAVAVTYHVMQISTDQVPPSSRPTAYEQLQHPAYFGRLELLDDDLTWMRGLIETRGRDATLTLFRELAKQSPTLRKDPRTLVTFITAGAHAIALNARLDLIQREQRGGGKTAWIAIEPVVTQPFPVAISVNTDRPNGARLLANFLLSLDAQTALAEAGRVPSRADADPDPQTLVQGIRTQLTLPPEGAQERELRQLWAEAWSSR